MRLRLAQADYQIQTFGARLAGGAAQCRLEGVPGGIRAKKSALRCRAPPYSLRGLCRRGTPQITDSASDQAENRVRGRAAGIMAERPRYRGQLTFQERDFLSAGEQA